MAQSCPCASLCTPHVEYTLSGTVPSEVVAANSGLEKNSPGEKIASSTVIARHLRDELRCNNLIIVLSTLTPFAISAAPNGA